MTKHDYLFADARILIFAKAPIAGQVKTRMLPVLSAEQAAVLHRQLVIDTVATVTAALLAPVVLCGRYGDAFL